MKTSKSTAANAGRLNQGCSAPAIPGLSCISTFIDCAECESILNAIDQQPWDCSLKRRVQQYGYRYNYRASSLDAGDYIGLLPDWLQRIATTIEPFFCREEAIQQVIVNEYLPGQGIASHIDHPGCFGNTVAVLSLLSLAVMDFVERDRAQKISIPLHPGSLLILQGESRFRWKHGIASRKSDRIAGTAVRRSRRVSLTFRSVSAGRGR